MAATFKSVPESDLWNWRMGHPSASLNSKFVKLDSKISFKNPCDCTICPLAEQTRLPFNSSFIKTTACFLLLYIDIGNLYSYFFISARYFLSIVDDYSRCTWIYLMKNKGQTLHFLKLFISMVKTQFGKTINRIRSDNGMEFVQREAQDFFILRYLA